MIPRAARICLCWRSSRVQKKCGTQVLYYERYISSTGHSWAKKDQYPTTYSVLCSPPMVSSSQVPEVIHHKLTAYWALHEFVCQQRYDEAMDFWNMLKSRGQVDSAIYGVVMAMCEKMRSADRARDVKREMEGYNLTMDEKCSLHYINALLCEDQAEEAVKFILEECSSEFRRDPTFLLKTASSFVSRNHIEHALSLTHQASTCTLFSPKLHSFQLELLGHLKRTDDMRRLVDEHYDGNLSSAALSVQLSMARGLALADKYKEAFEVVKGLKQDFSVSTVDPKTVTLLLESTLRAKDEKTGVEIYHQLWQKSFSANVDPTVALKQLLALLNVIEAAMQATDDSDDLVGAINAAIALQALVFRKNPRTHERGVSKARGIFPREFGWAETITKSSWQREISGMFQGDEDIRSFMSQNFYQQLLSWSLVPDQTTYEAFLLLSCYMNSASTIADQAIKHYVNTGGQLTPEAFTAWTHHCGPLLPRRVYKVLGLVFLHSDGYGVPLRLEEYKRLLGVDIKCGQSHKLVKEAADCIRSIKHVMHKNGHLNTTEEWNLVLSALSRIGNIGALVTTYNDMLECEHIKSNLNTFHALIDGNLKSSSHRNSRAVAYVVWRNLVKQVPRVKPDISLMNKLIRSCRICKSYERAFFFFSQFKELEVTPNLETFRELLKICREENDRKKFQTVVQLAKNCLPGEVVNINTVVSAYEQEWKTEEDIALANTIIGHVTHTQTIEK